MSGLVLYRHPAVFKQRDVCIQHAAETLRGASEFHGSVVQCYFILSCCLVRETILILRYDIVQSRKRTSRGRPAIAAGACGKSGKARRAFLWRGAQLLWPNVLNWEGEESREMEILIL